MQADCLKKFSLVALLSIGLVADATAHNPTGRRRTGTIEHVDLQTQRLTFRADREDKAKAYVWNKRTRFVREISFVEASALRSGSRADVTVHHPFFGEPFVSRVILFQPAPTARPRR
jgi:hypothetical protein